MGNTESVIAKKEEAGIKETSCRSFSSNIFMDNFQI